MHKPFVTLLFTCFALLLQAQTPDSLINEFKTVNNTIAAMPCTTNGGRLISNRAMNIFLANKVGTYLTQVNDLSLYKNSVTYNTAEGTLAVNHNLYTPKGIDDRVSSLMSVGVKANAADAFAASFAGRQYNNRFGFVIKQTWIAKGNTYFDGSCSATGQKKVMDAYRAGILHTIDAEINKKAADFEAALNDIDSIHDIPGQSTDAAKSAARQNFYAGLQDEYEYTFARLQSEAMAKTFTYRAVAVNWTSISLYIPLLAEKFRVAQSITTPFANKYACPLDLAISHTRFWESAKAGRFILAITGEAYWNNAKEGYLLGKTSFDDYRYMGGADTINAAKHKEDEFYIGNYKSFITPVLKAQLVYIPPDWHFGLTIMFEKNFGSYHALNGVIGVPIVLINKNAEPSINFEFQVRFFDIGNTINPVNGPAGKTSAGVSIGIPFSRIAY